MMRQRRGGGGTSATIISSEEEDQCDDDDDNQMNVGQQSLLDHLSSSSSSKTTTSTKKKNTRSLSLWLLFVPKRRRQQQQQEKTVVVVAVRFILFLLMIVAAVLLFSKIINYVFYNNRNQINIIMDPPSKNHNHHQDHHHPNLDINNLKNQYNYYEPIRQKSTDTYDVYNCPIIPPINYPREYPILDVLKNWPTTTNQTTTSNTQQQKQKIYQGVCIIDVSKSVSDDDTQQIISNYRSAEVPFIIRNDPKVLHAVNLWSNKSYLSHKLVKDKKYQATISNQTKLTYYSMDPNYNIIPNDFIPPTEHIPLSYDDWYQHSSSSDSSSSSSSTTTTNNQENKNYKYAYLRLDACLPNLKRCDSTYDPTTSSSSKNNLYNNADFIYNDLDFFRPSSSSSSSSESSYFYEIDMNKTRGIQCRFSPPGIIADENHFDNERNYIAMLKGKRRYILSHPQNCPTLYLYKQKHPFERHTSIDYNYISELLLLNDVDDVDDANHHNHNINIINELYPDFYKTTINEVVLMAGDVLYLPTYWFHHIISLDLNYQCNTRSGYSVEYDQIIYDCGFFYDFPS